MRMSGWLSAAFEVALPSVCLNCENSLPVGDPGLCRRCWDRLTPVTDPCCPRCAGPSDEPKYPCLSCGSQPPPHSGAVVWGEYDGDLRNAVIALKHHKHDELAGPLARRLYERITAEKWHPLPDLVTAVPSHLFYRLKRGYSAAEMVASTVARCLDIPMCMALKRHDFGRQARRSRAQREALGTRAFSLRRAATRVQDRRVLLIDDVMTTGATLQRASRVLLRAGARSVHCAALARTPDSRRLQ